MRLRICHLISGDLWAGAEVMAFQLLRGLSTLPGVDLFVIVLNKGRLSGELEKTGIPTCILDEGRQSFPEIVWRAARAVRGWGPHILHSHRYKENLLSWLVSFALRERAALVSTQHGMPELFGGRPGLLRRMKLRANFRLLATRFDRTVAVSSGMKALLTRDFGFREECLETIHNGISVPEARVRPGGTDRAVIGSAGRFVPVKDYPFMVEVAKAVGARTDRVRFELAGEGPMQGAIEGLIGKYRLQERFKLRGFVHDIGAFYDGLDVYLNTSLHEGIPMSVLEAMARGVPPVVPRVGGLEEIVTDGVDGYLVNGRNPRDFAERCLALCGNDGLRRNMARAAREKVAGQFSTERMIGAYLDLYARVTGRGGKLPAGICLEGPASLPRAPRR